MKLAAELRRYARHLGLSAQKELSMTTLGVCQITRVKRVHQGLKVSLRTKVPMVTPNTKTQAKTLSYNQRSNSDKKARDVRHLESKRLL